MTVLKQAMPVLLAVALAGLPLAAPAQENDATESWLSSLQTETPQEGFELAIRLARKGVTSTQTDKETLFREREEYSQDGEALIHVSEVIAVHFQTVAAANDYWK